MINKIVFNQLICQYSTRTEGTSEISPHARLIGAPTYEKKYIRSAHADPWGPAPCNYAFE